ncbi:MAG TPA: anthranilate synthase component I [Chthoniobacterales bacterium]|jgi:anthranilate synthase component 1|nr:anthranilate synthase component I [Chthoniobacterales bacterium]
MAQLTILPARDRFAELAKLGNVIPVLVDLVADGETPAAAFQKLEDGGYSFLFESAEQTEQSGRYSFLGFAPRLIVRGDDGALTIAEQGRTKTSPAADPLLELERIMTRFRFVPEPDLPRFAGGAVGFLGYDVVRYFEKTVPAPPEDDLRLPEMLFMIMGLLVVFDHRYRRLKIVANVFLDDHPDLDSAYSGAEETIHRALARLDSATRLPLIDAKKSVERVTVESNTTREQFEAAVRKAKEHIRAGDVFQVVLSQRFETKFAGDPLKLYRCLRLVNPSPYMFCLRFGEEFSLVGSSPELHVRVTDDVAEVRPIAGTRRRGATKEEDDRNAAELLADPKERAEHVMLIDLARNDLGRIAEIGSVQVTEQMVIERYSHVMHIGSHVMAKLRKDKTAYDVMRATFPAGTVSGAPKIRAMQIISELETKKRGCYAGAVGYFGFDGGLDCCIALRSIVLKEGRAYLQAGAGIVADSSPAGEYEETVNKAMAMIDAISRASDE